MDIQDIRQLPPEGTIEAEVCVVGSGPAGATVATELARSGVDVLVLESGELERTAHADALDGFESTGAQRVMDPWLVGNRLLGGTSATWWGRLATFDEVDFATRSWVSNSGWPLGRAELAPYLDRARAVLGGPVADNNDPAVTALVEPRWAGVDPKLFRPYVWTYSRSADQPGEPVRFGVRPGGQDGVRCLLAATVTALVTTPAGDRLEHLVVHGPDGSARSVVARHVVLAAGGIENARLLLTAPGAGRRGVGNAHDLVGRFLMDHPRGAVGTYAKRDQFAVQRLFNDSWRGTDPLITGVALAPEVQRAEQLLNCALFLHVGEVDDDDPLSALGELIRGRRPAASLAAVARHPLVLAENLRRRASGRREASLRARDQITLQCIVEQPPDAESRVTLSEQADAYGVPLPVVHWRLGEQEARTVRRTATGFAAEMSRRGLPVPQLEAWVTDPGASFHLPDVAHPIGTTRMSADPRTGVVDPDCAVHGVAGLHVAGSSVFPTSGHANPTQMIVALAIRLADHLAGRLGPGDGGAAGRMDPES